MLYQLAGFFSVIYRDSINICDYLWGQKEPFDNLDKDIVTASVFNP